MSNHLANESSPYLFQHAENPVEWYPWCDEAFRRAKAEDKPVFLSVGYSTCHWCHVMARESFENAETAKILNDSFICVKVDREERPDIDSVYMTVCQALTGGGGWPMSIFMTWDKKPFFAGTYFPPKSGYSAPGFSDVLSAIAEQWRDNRDELLRSAALITEKIKQAENAEKTSDSANLPDEVVNSLKRLFDSEYGGFGRAPKFPTPHNLLFLMMHARLKKDNDAGKMAEKTLLQMRKGGIFDHVGGGFSRYSTDRYYLVPHFEKMLYDNALLIIAYAAMYHISGKRIYLDTCLKTADYVLREMTSDEGGFYSAQDADSEGIEGKYYTFIFDEITQILGSRAEPFSKEYDITRRGNCDGANIPNLLRSGHFSSDFDEELKKLYDYRKKRSPLHLDDKILLSWNSMMIAAMSILYRVSKNEKYLLAALNAQRFTEENMRCGSEMYASFRNAKHSAKAFLDDYAYYTAALIELYNSTLDSQYLRLSEQICDEAVSRFSDKEGGYCMCESTELFFNPRETYDGAVPSGNSMMAYDLVRLYQLTENEKYRELADRQMEFMSSRAHEYPTGHCMFLLAKLLYENPPEHITIAVKNISDVKSIKPPFLVNVEVLQNNSKYPLINDKTTFYVC
ncbi:MAG: thioredoxin domain-containing protein, partial [Clostridia bacterium]|nr:thioredoxin domain-containing protein [Clostridia bacterium]